MLVLAGWWLSIGWLGGCLGRGVEGELRVESVSVAPCGSGRPVAQFRPRRFAGGGSEEGLQRLGRGCFAASISLDSVDFSNPRLRAILRRQRRSQGTLFFRRMFTLVELDLDEDSSEVEPCRHKWRAEERQAEEERVNRGSVCGGVGSCLYCGHQCSEQRREAEEWAFFRLYKRSESGRRRQLSCSAGLREEDRQMSVHFCLPPKEDFYRLIGLDERSFAQLFVNGKEFFVKAYVFYADRSLRDRAANVQNLELQVSKDRKAIDEAYENERNRLRAQAQREGRRISPSELNALSSILDNERLRSLQLRAQRARGTLRDYAKKESILCLRIQGNVMPSI